MATFYYGGQAVMEGVMMRGRRSAAMAVRRPDGSIYLYEEALNPRLYQNRLFRLPFLRGMLIIVGNADPGNTSYDPLCKYSHWRA